MFRILTFVNYVFFKFPKSVQTHKAARNRNYSHFINKDMEKSKGQMTYLRVYERHIIWKRGEEKKKIIKTTSPFAFCTELFMLH